MEQANKDFNDPREIGKPIGLDFKSIWGRLIPQEDQGLRQLNSAEIRDLKQRDEQKEPYGSIDGIRQELARELKYLECAEQNPRDKYQQLQAKKIAMVISAIDKKDFGTAGYYYLSEAQKAYEASRKYKIKTSDPSVPSYLKLDKAEWAKVIDSIERESNGFLVIATRFAREIK